MIWRNPQYNIGNGFNTNDGKFKAPVDGIYSFYTQAHSYGNKYAQILFMVNGSQQSYAKRHEDGDTDFVTLSSQFKLNKGDTVWVYFNGWFYNPTYERNTFFEGHLIRQINS